MFAKKVMLTVSLLGVFMLIVCSAQVAKSQPDKSSITEPKQPSGRSYTSGLGSSLGSSLGSNDPNQYMNQVFSHKPIDLFHLVPILLLLAFIPIVLPLIFQLFAGLFTPLNFTHGKRKRDTSFHTNPQMSQTLLELIKQVGHSLDKYQF